MNIKQLKSAIENLPDDMQVFIGPRLTEEDYGLLNSCEIKEILVLDDPITKNAVIEEVLILTED